MDAGVKEVPGAAELRRLVRLADAEGFQARWVELMEWAWTSWLDARSADETTGPTEWQRRVTAAISDMETEVAPQTWALRCRDLKVIRSRLVELPKFTAEVLTGEYRRRRVASVLRLMREENWFGRALSELRDVPPEDEIRLAFQWVDERCVDALQLSDDTLRKRRWFARAPKEAEEPRVRLNVRLGKRVLDNVNQAGRLLSRIRHSTGADKRPWAAYTWEQRLEAMAGYIIGKEEADDKG